MGSTTSAVAPVAFRFDQQHHEYIALATGEALPHITGMLEETGWIDDLWFTEESSERGSIVHRLTADYDLGALDVETCVSRHRGYLLGHVAAVTIARPTWHSVEVPLVHPTFRYGGRPDRDCTVYSLRSVWEVKSGGPHKAHRIQTALQAMLVSVEARMPAEAIARFCCYVKDKGKFKLEEHRDRRDFDEARRIIRRCCGV